MLGVRHICDECGIPKRISDLTNNLCTACLLTRRRGAPSTIPERWRRATIPAARENCGGCGGLGMVGDSTPCECAWTAIARSLRSHYRHVRERSGSHDAVSYTNSPHGVAYGRKGEEFVADLDNTIKRVARYLDAVVGVDAYRRIARSWPILEGRQAHSILARLGFNIYTPELGFEALRNMDYEVVREAVLLRPYALFPISDYNEGPRYAPLVRQR